MLRLSLPLTESLDESTQEFQTHGGFDVELEHSLYTVAKWEAEYKTPFMKADMDFKFILSYLPCMCLTEGVKDSDWIGLTQKQIVEVSNYLIDPQSATKITSFRPDRPSGSKTITAELVYSWMIAYQIPFSCEHWHFNRLITLIRVCEIEMNPKKDKMSKAQAMRLQRDLNDARKAKYNTKG